MRGGLRGTDGLSPGCPVGPFPSVQRGVVTLLLSHKGVTKGGSIVNMRLERDGARCPFFGKARMLYSPLGAAFDCAMGEGTTKGASRLKGGLSN